MGVNKLWDILLTIAVQKRIQDLSGLILAIDASLWIVKVNSIFQNLDEGLKCIFNKILWLKKNNIKPIFVFDGESPPLKRRTLQQRRNRRKQLNDLDISKKAQIQIVKAAQGSQPSQKIQNKKVYDEKAKQIQQMFNNLLKYEETTNTIELSEKLALQGQVLNKQYQLYCDMSPNIIKKYGDADIFSILDIQSKEQILEIIRAQDLPTYKDIQKIKNKMSEEQKIFYDMEVIKRKSKIRELQDQLYRKVLTKKIQNGYQIIQGVYNGKKVTQKRKVRDNKFDSWGYNRGKKDRCNNFQQIFQNKKNTQQTQQKQQKQQQIGFFSSLFSRDYTQGKKQQTNNTFSQISLRLSQESKVRKSKLQNYNKNKQKNKNKKSQNKFIKKKKSWQQSSSQKQSQKQLQKQSQQHSFSYQNCFNDNEVEVESKLQNKNKIQNENKDPDNFPDYIQMQSLDQTQTSTQNVHLQNILHILGINYIIAPYQAQAQCAALQQMGLVDGVVTQDSDVFLFGSRKVYRGIFQDNIRLFSMSKVQQKLMLTRQKLILFALMLGSDYTDGVKGIGIVNAMQILKVHHDLQSLQRFTSWARSADILIQDQQNRTDYILDNAQCEDEKQFYQLHRKYKNYWHVHPNFPQQNVYDAYMQPQIQIGQQLQKKVKQHKKIHNDALIKLMQQKFMMVNAQIQLNIKIFTKKFERKLQTQIIDYTSQGVFAKIASKRLQKAIDKPSIHH